MKIMKRTLKRWWSTIPSISAKRKISSHLNHWELWLELEIQLN